ncbi:hypothetical protein, partial [Lysinibacillus sp. Bpr_S20]|uniref:hypothetical protein n=1 Tax=Lysinibacillus sp. Bpr_S20 TaxID=2933964 RepID=UPI0020116C7A
AKAKRQQQMFSVAKAKRQLQSAQSEWKSTTRVVDNPKTKREDIVNYSLLKVGYYANSYCIYFNIWPTCILP